MNKHETHAEKINVLNAIDSEVLDDCLYLLEYFAKQGFMISPETCIEYIQRKVERKKRFWEDEMS
jgi:hypothetical protein